MPELKRAIALGFFDGVHIGHAALLERTKLRAAEIGAAPAVLSFDVHPDTLVLHQSVPLINSAAGREEIIRRCFGIDEVIFVHFDRQTMQMPWQAFADSLIDELQAGWLVVGHDFRFGWRGEGTAERLENYAATRGVGCDIVPAVTLDGRIVSSTYIRELIRDGDMEQAARYLGHPHCLEDRIRSGRHLGTRIGAPTINMAIPQGVIVPRRGVYASRVSLETGESWTAVTNVGVRPTVSEEGAVSVESHLLGFEGDLYGKRARVDFYAFLREERRFADLEALSAQIRADAENAGAWFRSCADALS